MLVFFQKYSLVKYLIYSKQLVLSYFSLNKVLKYLLGLIYIGKVDAIVFAKNTTKGSSSPYLGSLGSTYLLPRYPSN
jgi:hypothetical protein